MVVAPPAGAPAETRTFVHNGYSRPYIIHRQANLPSHPAVVFMLGGIGSTAKSASEEFHWMDEADRNGFLVVFPEPVATQTDQPANRNNITFWEMKGSRTHRLAPGALPVDDDGYLMAVLHEILRRDHVDSKRVFFAGFSSGSGAVQFLASHHPKEIRGVVAVATPLMDPPPKLARPLPILYIHGDNDEQFAGFEVNGPNFATTPHGNWVTWGYLNGCQLQTAAKTALGSAVCLAAMQEHRTGGRRLRGEFRPRVGRKPGLRRTYGSIRSARLDFTEMAWKFFAAIPSK